MHDSTLAEELTRKAVDALDVAVTRAIRDAERLEDAGDVGARPAYGLVSSLEEALAALHPAEDVEGAIARCGAVTAALRAGQRDRAVALARRYEADPGFPAGLLAESVSAFESLAPGLLSASRDAVRGRFVEGPA